MNFHAVTINCSSFSREGHWGVAERRFGGEYVQMLAPVFENKFTAEVFAAWYPTARIDETPEAELIAARELELFIRTWDEQHADDDRFPTKDGRYPSAVEMAKWFAASRAGVAA